MFSNWMRDGEFGAAIESVLVICRDLNRRARQTIGVRVEDKCDWRNCRYNAETEAKRAVGTVACRKAAVIRLDVEITF